MHARVSTHTFENQPFVMSQKSHIPHSQLLQVSAKYQQLAVWLRPRKQPCLFHSFPSRRVLAVMGGCKQRANWTDIYSFSSSPDPEGSTRWSSWVEPPSDGEGKQRASQGGHTSCTQTLISGVFLQQINYSKIKFVVWKTISVLVRAFFNSHNHHL